MVDRMLRALILLFVRCLYRVRTDGADRVPAEGGVLLIANHVSYADALVISLACPRHVRFLAYETLVERGLAGWIMRRMGVIPISSTRAKEAIVRASDALRAGEAVCIFPEGQLSRTGVLNEIRRGFEMIARRGKAPVVPLVIDRMWGSIFSFEGGRFFTKLPRRIPLRVSVAFGESVGSKEAKSEWARAELLRLGADAYASRWELQRSLPEALVRAMVRESWRTAIVHRSQRASTSMSRAAVLAIALGLARRWKRSLPEDDRVGVALPPGFPATIVHLGLVLAGKSPVDLPFWAGTEIRIFRDSGIRTVVTSRAISEGAATSFPWPPTVLDMRGELDALSKLGTLARRIGIAVSPAFLMAWRFRKRTAGAGYVTADGDFVALSGMAIQANARQIVEASVVRSRDVLLSAVSLTEPEGQQYSLWLPILEGAVSVSMPTVTDAEVLENILVHEEVTLVAATEEILRTMHGETIASRTPELRALLAFRESAWITDLADQGVCLLRGWAVKEWGTVIASSTFDPEVTTSTAEPQDGARAGSVGRLLPGVAGERGDDGNLRIYAPALGVGEMRSLDMPGRFDEDGFLFLGDAPAIAAAEL